LTGASKLRRSYGSKTENAITTSNTDVHTEEPHYVY